MHQNIMPLVHKNDSIRMVKNDSAVHTKLHPSNTPVNAPQKRFDRTVVRPIDERILPAELKK